MPDDEEQTQLTSQVLKQHNRKMNSKKPDRENEEEEDYDEEDEDADFNPFLIADTASEASSSISSEDEGSADNVNIEQIQESDVANKAKDKSLFSTAPTNETCRDSEELLKKDEEDAICMRTRARHSLADYTLEELETFLQESDDDEDLQNVDDEEEYRKFLSAVLSTGNAPGNEKDADEDEDNDADFEIEIEEALDSDVDDNRGKHEKDGRSAGTRQKRTQRSSVTNKSRPLAQVSAPLRPILPLTNGPVELASQLHVRPSFSQRLSNVEPSCGFTSQQIGQLYCLINEHVQLLIQVYSLSAHDPARQYVADKAQGLLLEMTDKREQALTQQRIPYPVHCFEDLKAYQSTYFDPSQSANFRWAPPVNNPVFSVLDVKSLGLTKKYIEDISASMLRYQKERMDSTYVGNKLQKEPLFPLRNCEVAQETSAAEVIDDVDTIAGSNSPSVKPRKTLAATLVERTKTQSALVPGDIASLAQAFHFLFNPSLFPHKPPPFPVANRVLFTDSEDGLLAMGIMEYNNDWRAIQQRFLPGKSEHQIFVRQKNRSSSKAPENPIKAVRRMKTSPLTAEEKVLIAEGLRLFKHEWIKVWRLFVPHRDPSLLPRQWRTATGTQKSYRKDESINEKRRVYEAKRRKLKASSSEWKATLSEQELDEADDEDEAFVHEAFLADNDLSHQESNRQMNENFQFAKSVAQQMAISSQTPSSLPSTSSHVQYTYRQRKRRGTKVVKLAPELPPVNLPASVRVISQSAFRSYHPDKSPLKVLFSNVVHPSKAAGRPKNGSERAPKEGDSHPETNVQMHPLLFQMGDAEIATYRAKNCWSTAPRAAAGTQGGACSPSTVPAADFHPMLQRVGDIINGGPSNCGIIRESGVAALICTGEKDNTVGFESGVCLEESEDRVSSEIVMEQEELSDSEEEADDVKFECEEMDDSEDEDLDHEPSRDVEK